MPIRFLCRILWIALLLGGPVVRAAAFSPDTAILEGRVSPDFLRAKLRGPGPHLILTPALQARMRQDIRTLPVMEHVYGAFRLDARRILDSPLLRYQKTGKRLLAVSREMLYRMNILGMVYAMEGDKKILARIDSEVREVCAFPDWNPPHFLDVAEMSMAVSLALDWTGGALPAATRKIALRSLLEKGITPSFGSGMWWIQADNNWNQVCHGGMIAAALSVAEQNPDIAARTINRAIEGMPHALAEYAPDGVYPEGATYWGYGTTFTALTASMLQTALGEDFGLSGYTPLLKSALFRLLSVAPSGDYYNFSDCGLTRGPDGDMTLAWFAALTGNPGYFERARFLRDPASMGELPRYAGAGLVWIDEYLHRQASASAASALPVAWKGEGPVPVVFFRRTPGDTTGFYLGAKGGKGNHNHGNLDAGSFVFELNGVRWVVDPGTQDYYEVEKTGFDLWGMCQTCDRWKLLTKNNFGHSTLVVNDSLFDVTAYAALTDFRVAPRPEAAFDLSGVYDGRLAAVTRRFVKENDHSLLVEDHFKTTDSTRMITWQLITTAAVQVTPDGALLSQDGRRLRVRGLSSPRVPVSVVSLDPPPLALDKRIPGLKRLELRFPASLFPGGDGSIRVRLSAP